MCYSVMQKPQVVYQGLEATLGHPPMEASLPTHLL